MGTGASRDVGSASFCYVRIVRAGGKVERYDKPVLARDVMVRNPKHCVTRSKVFRSPVEKAILSPEELLMPGEKYYLLPHRTVCTLFKRQNSDKADFSEFLSPLSTISVSPCKVAPIRKTCTKSPHKNWPRPSPARTPAKKATNEASQAAVKDLEQRQCLEEKRRAEEMKQKQLGRGADYPARSRRTLADHLKASPPLSTTLPQLPTLSKASSMQNRVELRSPVTKSMIKDVDLRKRRATDEGELTEGNADVILLIDPAQTFLVRKRPLMRAGRSPTAPLFRSASMGVRRRPWVPRLQTLHECSP